MNKKPYISFVISVRSNKSSEDFTIKSVESFHAHLSKLCNDKSLCAELIVVDWNSGDAQSEFLRDLSIVSQKSLPLRLISVPTEIHEQFRNSDTVPFFELIARNVGIRRASAPFILATSIDTVFSDNLIRFLAKQQLNPNKIYTLYCRKLALDMSELSDGSEHNLRRSFLRPAWRFINQQIHQPFSRPRPQVYDDVCRNFVLMSKEAWGRVEGYLELPIYPLYLDELLLHSAVSLGLRQIILDEKFRLDHIERETFILDLSIEERVKRFPSSPWLDGALWERLKQHYIDGGKPIVLNGKDWGLAKYQLEELHING